MKTILMVCTCVMLSMAAIAIDNSIKTVSIDPKVAVCDGVYTENPDSIWGGAALGLIGSVAMTAGDDEDLLELLKKNNVHIDKIVHQKFSEELTKSKIFSQITTANPDATIHLKVDQYGIGCPAFSTDLRPILEVVATLQDKKGKVLWTDSKKVNSLEEKTPAHDWDDYTANGRLFQTGFEKAAELVSIQLIDNLQHPEESKKNAAPPREGGEKKSKTVNVGGKKGM